MEKPNDLVSIPREVLSAVLAYLAERPWREVHRLIAAISSTTTDLPANQTKE
jgi:hypothetical protein